MKNFNSNRGAEQFGTHVLANRNVKGLTPRQRRRVLKRLRLEDLRPAIDVLTESMSRHPSAGLTEDEYKFQYGEYDA
jgi:hypothetical protein